MSGHLRPEGSLHPERRIRLDGPTRYDLHDGISGAAVFELVSCIFGAGFG